MKTAAAITAAASNTQPPIPLGVGPTGKKTFVPKSAEDPLAKNPARPAAAEAGRAGCRAAAARADLQQAASIDRGVLLVLTGNGKGKSSSAFGMVARMLGHGLKPAVAQFIKGRSDTGEEAFFRAAGVPWLVLGEGFTWETQNLARDIETAQRGWSQVREFLRDPAISLVVLDELTYPLKYGWLDLATVLDDLEARPAEPGLQRFHPRKALLAGAAPGRPEIHIHSLAAQCGEADCRIAVLNVRQCEVGGLLTLFQCHGRGANADAQRQCAGKQQVSQIPVAVDGTARIAAHDVVSSHSLCRLRMPVQAGDAVCIVGKLRISWCQRWRWIFRRNPTSR